MRYKIILLFGLKRLKLFHFIFVNASRKLIRQVIEEVSFLVDELLLLQVYLVRREIVVQIWFLGFTMSKVVLHFSLVTRSLGFHTF